VGEGLAVEPHNLDDDVADLLAAGFSVALVFEGRARVMRGLRAAVAVH
jgi:hypothetical protein